MDTLEVLVPADPELHDLLVAALSEIGYEAFLETDRGLAAYLPAERDDAVLRERTVQIAGAAGVSRDPEFRIVLSRNWNEEWEHSMGRVEVGRFVILPPWASPPVGDEIPLLIEPKMSFGTGHHESTRLALQLLERVVTPGNLVLDAGTGTGVLAIAAVRLGASKVVAFDIDPWSAVNCAENIERNAMAGRIQFVQGELADVSETDFDVAVANISRNTLLGLLPEIDARMVPGGAIILSGLLATDREVMLGRAAELGLGGSDELQDGEWWATVLRKRRQTDDALDRDH